MWVGVSLGFGVEGSCVSSNKPLKRIARGGEQLRRPAADPHTIGGRGSGGQVPQARGGFRTEEDVRAPGRQGKALSRAICCGAGRDWSTPGREYPGALLPPMRFMPWEPTQSTLFDISCTHQ
jgi:hypothetical protein